MDVGISEPSDYSEEKMLEIKDELDTVKASGAKFAKRKPNVIVVQLESFMDPSYVKELSFNILIIMDIPSLINITTLT